MVATSNKWLSEMASDHTQVVASWHFPCPLIMQSITASPTGEVILAA